MKGKIGDKQRLQHILKAIVEIENYVYGADKERFLRDSMMKYACVKQIEIIGEAAVFLSSDFQSKHSEIEWKEIKGIRNLLVHEYFGIDFNILWQIILEDIPKLKPKIEKALNSFK